MKKLLIALAILLGLGSQVEAQTLGPANLRTPASGFIEFDGGTSNTFTCTGGHCTIEGTSILDTSNLVGGAGIDLNTLTLDFDATELTNLTWGSGSGFAWTFNAGATDPVWTYGSGTAGLTSSNLTIGAATGLATYDSSAATPNVQAVGISSNLSSFGSASFINDSSSPNLQLAKSRGATVGSYTVVQSGDNVGIIRFNGADGTDFAEAANIRAQVDGTPGANDMPGRLAFYTTADGAAAATERMRITNCCSIGMSAGGFSAVPISTFQTGNFPGVQILGNDSEESSLGLADFQNTAGSSPNIWLGKSRGTTAGSYTIVQSGDNVGYINFDGADGSQLEQAAQITAQIDNTPGADDMPGRLMFLTSPDGTKVPVERMRIDNAGKTTIGNLPGAAESGWNGGTETPVLQINATSGVAQQSISLHANGSGGSELYMGHTRGTALASYTIVQNGDLLGSLFFQGADGVDMANGATISAAVDGTPGSNDMPTSISLSTTPDGSASALLGLKINASVASAVNAVTIQNAATGTGPTISVGGASSDTNANLLLAGKGTGVVKGANEAISVAASDESSAIPAGTGKVKFRMPYAFTLQGVRCSLGTAQSSGGGTLFTVDINESGTSVISTKLTFDDTEKTTTTAATAAVISDSSLADDAEMSIDVDSVGTSADAAGLKCSLIGHQ